MDSKSRWPFWKKRYRVQSMDFPGCGHTFYKRENAIKGLRSQCQTVARLNREWVWFGCEADESFWEVRDLHTNETIEALKVIPPKKLSLEQVNKNLREFAGVI